MKRTKAAGAARERQVRELFRSRGYVVFKSSDSSVADVIAVKSERMFASPYPGDWFTVCGGYLIEVKANHGSPFMNFRAPERAALRAVAEQAGLEPLLVHWAPGKPPREIPASEWPNDQQEAA